MRPVGWGTAAGRAARIPMCVQGEVTVTWTGMSAVGRRGAGSSMCVLESTVGCLGALWESVGVLWTCFSLRAKPDPPQLSSSF